MDTLRQQLSSHYLMDEETCVKDLLAAVPCSKDQVQAARRDASNLAAAVRRAGQQAGLMEAFLHEYDLSSEEGVVLMCLAEALLRIPDEETADRLIQDKLQQADWDRHLGHSASLLVNASTWGLMLTGRLVRLDLPGADGGNLLNWLLSRSSEPVVRTALRQAMRIMARQFVMGRNISEAIARSQEADNRNYLYSFDMLGEAALGEADARRYHDAYLQAIQTLGQQTAGDDVMDRAGISIKLSALHPRYEALQAQRVLTELVPRVVELVRAAEQAGIGLTIDAEEADRLDLSLQVFQQVFTEQSGNDWQGFGMAVQAYQKRARPVIRWLCALARETKTRIPVRLVKGAYWDTEIKRAQERGLCGYPVFTRKSSTDVSFLACAGDMVREDFIYSQFATHNAMTLATVRLMAGERRDYEFQRLHGMGEQLYKLALQTLDEQLRCRVYAPVGSHEDLLPYLVRRLLENGANTSFVNRIEDEAVPLQSLTEDPLEKTAQLQLVPHPRIALPDALYAEERRNSRGINLWDATERAVFLQKVHACDSEDLAAAPLIDAAAASGEAQPRYNPAMRDQQIGTSINATEAEIRSALDSALQAFETWNSAAIGHRADTLDRAADRFQDAMAELVQRIVREGGRTVADAISEVREAIDFLRYYAAKAREHGNEQLLPGPTGERNILKSGGRGVFLCISPWNFPLAIFTGQIAAALVSGNTVLAKPASATPLTGMRAVQLLHEAGVPGNVLHYLPAESALIEKCVLDDPRLAGVAFTGATATAWRINRRLAARDAAIIPLIAETGGQNAMIVDSSALVEQVVADTLVSAFNSTGQRCSALRVLYVQKDIQQDFMEGLAAAIAELRIGNPIDPSVDIGPMISLEAKQKVVTHLQAMAAQKALRLHSNTGIPDDGCFEAPAVVELDSMRRLSGEIFGPVLHVIPWAANDLDKVIADINNTGYGLTLGIHSRIGSLAEHIAAGITAGNVYINRNMIGAVVGVQPFGGSGLSGTGPKAGGPAYLYRFMSEKTITTNTAAVGGNTELARLPEQD